MVHPAMKRSASIARCGAFAGMKWSDVLLNSNEYASVSFSICSPCKDPVSGSLMKVAAGIITPGIPMEGYLGHRLT